jgi:hypothetical protein
MGKRNRYREHVDPEYQRWGRRYPQFPGVAECVRLIRAGEARGAWADIIAHELAENAESCWSELIEAFRNDSGGAVRLYVLVALDLARVPACVPFLAEVLREADPRYVPFAQRALRVINTPEARKALWNAAHSVATTTEQLRGE